MKIKNVNLNTLLYIVDADNIKAVKPDAISKMPSGRIKIIFNNSYRQDIEAEPEAEQINQYYLNFADAKKKQSEIRKNQIEEAYKTMQKVISKYNEIVEKYFDKPLTSDSEVEIINY